MLDKPFGWSVQDLNQSSGVSNWDTNWSFSMAKMMASDRYGRSMTVQDMIYTRWISHMLRLLEGISIYRYDQMHNFMNIYIQRNGPNGFQIIRCHHDPRYPRDTRDPCDAWGSKQAGKTTILPLVLTSKASPLELGNLVLSRDIGQDENEPNKANKPRTNLGVWYNMIYEVSKSYGISVQTHEYA